jgi:hypothetical protein
MLLNVIASTLVAASVVHGFLDAGPRTLDPAGHNDSETESAALWPRAPTVGGIGAEFEAPAVKFVSSECNEAQTFYHRKHIIAGRTGKNFVLTADSTGKVGALQAEYILDGKQIKIGTGDAARAAKAAVADFVSP